MILPRFRAITAFTMIFYFLYFTIFIDNIALCEEVDLVDFNVNNVVSYSNDTQSSTIAPQIEDSIELLIVTNAVPLMFIAARIISNLIPIIEYIFFGSPENPMSFIKAVDVLLQTADFTPDYSMIIDRYPPLLLEVFSPGDVPSLGTIIVKIIYILELEIFLHDYRPFSNVWFSNWLENFKIESFRLGLPFDFSQHVDNNMIKLWYHDWELMTREYIKTLDRVHLQAHLDTYSRLRAYECIDTILRKKMIASLHQEIILNWGPTNWYRLLIRDVPSLVNRPLSINPEDLNI